MFKIIPFKKEHIECMDVRTHEAHLINDETLAGLEQSVAITGIQDGRIISCGGFIPYHHGNADAWQIPSVYIEACAKEYALYVYKWLDKTAKEYGLRRLETLCINDEFHDRWMSFMGFEEEGIKRQWLNETDYKMWGRIL